MAQEAGPAVKVRPIGVIHAYNFHYDEQAQYMLSVCYVMAYEGGEVIPGDDMRGSRVGWFGLDALQDEQLKVIVPPQDRWLFQRAIDTYRLYKNDAVSLQPDLAHRQSKYDLVDDE